ncbi:MAG: TetR/AcrR family transcriptional regulator [Oleibacter sp.]|nr:TetR/AcrR family transcriptional regulator [Thalassolituus sp.]
MSIYVELKKGLTRVRSRNPDEKLERREAILDAAEEAFIQQRFDKTSMNSIAQSAGFSRGLLYVYFHDKEDIHIGLCARAGDLLHQRMAQYTEKCATGFIAMAALGEAYLDFYYHERDYFRILTLASGLANIKHNAEKEITPSQQAFIAAEKRIMTLMASCVQRGIDDHSVDTNVITDPMKTAMYMRGSLHGLIMLQDAGGSSLFDIEGIDRQAWLAQCKTLISRAMAPK